MFDNLFLLYEFGLFSLFYIKSHQINKPCPLNIREYHNKPSTFMYSIQKYYQNGKNPYTKIYHFYKIHTTDPIWYIEKINVFSCSLSPNYDFVLKSDYNNDVQYYVNYNDFLQNMHKIYDEL
jgi:hypothetical protein